MEEQTYLFYLQVKNSIPHLGICRYQSDEIKQGQIEINDLDGFFKYVKFKLSHIRYGKTYYRLTQDEFVEIILRYG